MEEEDLRNFEERCSIMDQESVDVEEFIAFMTGDGVDESENFSPSPSRRTSRAELIPRATGNGSSPTSLPSTGTVGSTPRNARRSSLTRLKSISIMASNQERMRGMAGNHNAGDAPMPTITRLGSSSAAQREEIAHLVSE